MSDQSDHATLVILAGGLGSRMGMPKAHLQVAGQPILSWMLKRIGWHGPTMLALTPAVSTAPGMELFDQCVVDPIDGLGPARGLLTRDGPRPLINDLRFDSGHALCRQKTSG